MRQRPTARSALRSARTAGAALGLLAAAAAAVPARAEIVPTGPDVFGSEAIRADSLEPFPKWRGALERSFRERGGAAAACEPGLFAACPLRDWQAFLDSVADAPPERQMRRVNAFLNRARYILDIVNWRVKDYWASPLQFLTRDGDCEDYAIAKFMSLRALGFPNRALRIVVLRDLNLRIAHAVLVVELGGRRWVLDNQIPDVVPEGVIRHYRPIYSVNETHWWLHRGG